MVFGSRLKPRLAPPLTVPKELVEVSMLHVLKDHDEWVALHTDSIELDNVLMLEVGQQLSFTVEVLAGIVTGILQRLLERGHQREGRFNRESTSES